MATTRRFRPVNLTAVVERNARALVARDIAARLVGTGNIFTAFSALTVTVEALRESQNDVSGLVAEVKRLRDEKKVLVMLVSEHTGLTKEHINTILDNA